MAVLPSPPEAGDSWGPGANPDAKRLPGHRHDVREVLEGNTLSGSSLEINKR